MLLPVSSKQRADYESLSREEIRDNLNKIGQLILKGVNQLEMSDETYEQIKKEVLKDISDIMKDLQ